MPTTTHIDDQWVDIVPPEVPLATGVPITIIVFVSMFAVLLALGIFFYNRPRRRAKRAVRRLAHDLQRSQDSTKLICFRIRQYLREGFVQHRLQSVQLAYVHQADWQAYLNKLNHCCFAAERPTASELDSVIHEALKWLNKKAVNA